MIMASLSPGELEEMGRTQRKRFIFGETEYRTRKVVIIPGETGGKKVKVWTKVVKGEIPWIMGKKWME